MLLGGMPLMVDGLVRRTGRSSVQALWALGQLSLLQIQVFRAMIRTPPRRGVVTLQLYQIGFLSLPVVVLTGVAIGLVLAVQGYSTLRAFNAENVLGAMVNFSLVTQLAPVVTGLMLAGRVGSAIAAEIGSMSVSEQVDALRTMGTDPVSYLVVPRFLACVLLLPLLTAIGCYAGMVGAEFLALRIWNVDPAAYWDKSAAFLDTWDILVGLGKTVVFGATIALVACRKGLRTEGGSAGVGIACTEGVVAASILILVENFVLTLVAQKIAVLLHI